MTFFQRLHIIELVLVVCVGSSVQLSAQDCESQNNTFQAGEELTYVVSYDWFVVWTDVAEVKLSISDTSYQGNPAYKFAAVGETYPSWNWIFRVKDEFESVVDKQTIKPYSSKRVIRENKYRKYDNYQYDFQKSLAYSNVSRDNESFKKDTLEISSCTFDIMSSLLYARNLDFSSYAKGDSIPLTIILDKESYPVYIRYLGTEKFNLKKVGTFDCIKFEIMLIEGDMFDEGDNMTIWATNDKNRIVVAAESPILVGKVKTRISKIRGARYPVSSLTKKKK